MTIDQDRDSEDAARAARLLEGLAVPAVACVALAAPEDSPAPDEREARLVAGASPRRIADFLSGRACARAALQKLGLPAEPILSGPSREPLWPEGIVGSITHCAGLSAAAVARRADISALGIDAERTVVSADLEEMILSPSECRLMPPQDEDARQVLRSLLFSIKESVFKCVFPATRIYVDFREVSVTLSGDDRFVAEISAGLAVPDRFRAIAGRYASTRNFVVSLAQIAATP